MDFQKFADRSVKPRGNFINVERATTELKNLLVRRAPEAPIHKFLEEHPYLLPGIDALHHGPYEGIIATKLSLGRSFITDFAYIA